jgi:class 3 adenylate cyclase/tetratricopeptide (TPR) repeat protein
MKCPKCQYEIPEGSRFCNECGSQLEITCPKCRKANPPGSKFCNGCGQKLEKEEALERKEPFIEGERKQVTVLFSDLSGYTAMSERLDPEEVKEIMSQVFGEITSVVNKYDGSIQKFMGDAVVAFFGVPKTHEDDPVRAIRAAREIHSFVETMSPRVEQRVGGSLSMHTGINTGLVVTGQVDQDGGTTGVLGDTINVASRLSDLAKAGEILVGLVTYQLGEGHFLFEKLEPAQVKGKAEVVQVYRVLSTKEKPLTLHRTYGSRADLIGRKAELVQLQEAVQRLRQGKGGIFSICGDAGTGKTRLLEEFRGTLDLNEIQWREGHAYAYSQNIPYFPLIDLLNRTWQIEEGDSPGKVRGRIESGIENLIGKKKDALPFIGSLYSLSYPEIEGVSPEFWRSGLIKAVQTILSALAQSGPTIICLEDIHWADPSSLDLLRSILLEFSHPVLFICVYRLPFSLFTSHQLGAIGKSYQEIKLQDLSTSDAQDMMESLLKSKTIPHELRKFIQEKVEGNPFYLEEVINSLIESGTLIRDNGNWRLSRPINQSDISPTVQGVISARLDRLEREMKRILQEASVIGRVFLYEILTKITELKERLDHHLHRLEQFDLIRIRSLQPELEYVFKHALTQEVVYSGLLKKERQAVHERIALVMEQLFRDRLSEFYETLAFHFKRGQSLQKAVDYLMKSGEKSLKRYAIEESDQYYQEAFDLLKNKPSMTDEEKRLLIDLLNKWALVFYYRGDFGGLVSLLRNHEGLAESVGKAELGMFYGWLGLALGGCGNEQISYENLCKALKIGEEIGDRRLIGYACAWLTWTCAGLGLLDEALAFGHRALDISRSFESDPYLYFKSLGGIGYVYYQSGDTGKTLEAGKAILDYGERHSNVRSLAVGHWTMGFGYIMCGDFHSAIECIESGIRISADPFYSQTLRTLLGLSYLSTNQLDKAEAALEEVMTYCQKFGVGLIGVMASNLMGVLLIAKGRMSQGLELLAEGQRTFLENGRRCMYARFEHALGKVYSQIVEGSGSVNFPTIAKNIGFVIKNVPFAGKRAEDHFNKAIEVAKETGMKGILGHAYLDLGLLYGMKGKTEQAKKCLSEAIRIFEQTEAEGFLKQAKEALASFVGGK